MQFPESYNQSQKAFGCSEMAIKKGIVQIYKDGIASEKAILGGGEQGSLHSYAKLIVLFQLTWSYI